MDSHEIQRYWSHSIDGALQLLRTSRYGLSSNDARSRIRECEADCLGGRSRVSAWLTLLAQFKSPITLLLVIAAAISLILHDTTDAAIILIILAVSGLLSFWQEHGAKTAVARLLTLVAVIARVRRDGEERQVPVEEVLPGDVVLLSAGSSIPADCLMLESHDLFVNEAALTGETFPVEKAPGMAPNDAPLAQRPNVLFMGTHVVSGTGIALAVHTGRRSELGRISEHLRARPPETEFEHGIRRFGHLLLEVTLLLVISIFAINVYLQKPVMESFMFALALAVGLTPQLLPAIISVNLAHGARRMASQSVIVKRLASIENLGSMTVLCSDKTGTLTEGVIRISSAVDCTGRPSDRALRLAYLNARFETGYANPIDDAIRRHQEFDLAGVTKLDEVPYDFQRKRLSVLIEEAGHRLIVTKGAFANLLDVCTTADCGEQGVLPIAALREQIERLISEWSEQALRVLAVCCKDAANLSALRRADESDMTLVGFLLLNDAPKPEIAETLRGLGELGVRLVCVTGDNRMVAAAVGRQVGWQSPVVVSGTELNAMSDEALAHRAPTVDIFAEVEPNQKERIIRALRKSGCVVGYMGDGINDAPALHAADVSISVNTAVDVAKGAADIVLLRPGLNVLIDAVREGRTTFVNTMKYVHMATSANFGNMFSMAGASLFLPFLPLLPKQVLMTNLLTDFPEMAIATDRVDPELAERPRRWDLRFIRRFMLVFGLLGSIFDYLTFGALVLIFRATPEQFRTGWFIESVLSASLVVLVIRSRRPFFRSVPGVLLSAATLLTIGVTLLVPYSPLAAAMGLTPLPAGVVLAMLTIVLMYLLSAEFCKRFFYRRFVP